MKKTVWVLCDMPDSFFQKANLNESYQFIRKEENNLTSEEKKIASGVIFTTKTIINSDFLDQYPNLEFVGRAGSGLDNVDLKETARRGVKVHSSPEGNCTAVAEHTIGVLLNLLNRISISNQEVKHEIWQREENRGTALSELTVGVIGHGHTGSEVVKRLIPFACRILVVDPGPLIPIMDGVEHSSMQQVFDECDVISFHTPLTSDTYHMGNLKFFQSFKKPITLLNMARGEVVDLYDVVTAYKKGYILQAGIDVFHNEKMNISAWKNETWYQEIRNIDDFILTPHVAGWNSYSKHALGFILLKKIIKEN